MRGRLLAALALSGGAFGAPAFAQSPEDGVTGPNWRKRPSQEDLFTVWPKEAMKRGQSGKGVISCKVSVQGALFDCVVVSEDPPGSGFGGAAIALTPQFLMTPAMKDGKPIAGGTVRIPINFVWPAGSPGVSGIDSKTVVSNVAWREAPTYADMIAVFPPRAREKGLGGGATLACEFTADGRIKNCRSLSEAPWGMGFGTAAKSLSSRFVGPTSFRDGTSTKGATTQIKFTFPVEMLATAEPIIGKPRWAALPTSEQMVGAIPAEATAAGIKTARVVLDCLVVAEGRLETCRVASEDPPGKGFGSSTLALAEHFRLTIWTAEGLPTVGGRVKIPVRYETPEPAAPKP